MRKNRGLKSINFIIGTLLLVFAFTLLVGVLPAWAGVDKESIKPKLAKVSIPFIENQGQIKDSSVKFYANTFAGNVLVNDKGEIVYFLVSKVKGQESVIASEAKQSPKARFFADAQNDKKEETKGWVIKERIQGFKGSSVQGIDKAETKINYFVGNKKENWRNNIPSYNSVSLGEIYDGIELKLKAYGKNVEKLFIVNPGADVSKIAISLEGVNSIKINESKEMEIETGLGTLKFTKPYAYQEIDGKRIEVAAGFSLRNSELVYGFEVASYNKDYPLVIDPLLGSTFLGGRYDDEGDGIAIDRVRHNDYVYVTGRTYSPDFPTTPGAYDTTCDTGCSGRPPTGISDVFVSKFNADLSILLASTFIGGSDVDGGHAIVIDRRHNVFVTGVTWSSDYPTTGGAYDTTYNGGRDVLVSKLDQNLSTLCASTFIGGTNDDGGMSIDIRTRTGKNRVMDIDCAGNQGNNVRVNDTQYVYASGFTESPNYPVNGYDISYNGGWDAFVSRLDPNLSANLVPGYRGTFLGGTSDDAGTSVAVMDKVFRLNVYDVYVTGWTKSPDYPTTVGAYATTFNGVRDVIVSKLNVNLSILLASTFIGGGNDDGGTSISIERFPMGQFVHVTGWTYSSDYPTTVGAYDTTFNGGSDVFVSALNTSLSGLPASTFIGGSNDDIGYSIAVRTIKGGIYVTGWTYSLDYPTTVGAYDRTCGTDGNCNFDGTYYYSDVFVSALGNSLPSLLDLSTLTASTYIGGSNYDGGNSIAFNRSSNRVCITGQTLSPDYPTTPVAYDRTCGTDGFCNVGYWDAIVSCFTNDLSASLPDLVVSFLTVPLTGGAGQSISIGDTTSNNRQVSAGASTTRFYLSTNITLDGGDTPLGSRAVPALGAGASSAGTTSVTIPGGTAVGTYYIIARADTPTNVITSSAIAETNENNNSRLRVIRIR